ncbi:MAG TPA: hypothetical protein VF429_08545 [Anaerolineae bacterium]
MQRIFLTACFGCLALISLGCSALLPAPVPTQPPTIAPLTAAPTKKAAPAATLVPTATPIPIKPLKMNSPEYGAQAFLWWRPETADRDLGLMRDAGLTWVKQQFAWRDIEGAGKGKFIWDNADQAVNLSNAKGIDILARVDNAPDWAAPGCFSAAKKTMGPAKNTQDWLDFLTAFVTRYKGRIRAYEIWNEPNLAREWCSKPPSPSAYAALLKASYDKIKSIDPNAMIVSAGLTPTTQSNSEAMPDATFVEQMYAAMKNNSTGYFDALGVHAPGFKAPPETSPDDVARNPAYNHGEGAAGRIYSFRHVEDIRKIMVAHNDSAKQIVILEFGWTQDSVHPAYAWFRVDEQTQAAYIVGAFQYAKKNWSPWIGAMFVIYMANPDWTKDTEEYWWSIDEPDGTPRGAYVRLKAMAK